MDTNKIVRAICYFSDNPSEQTVKKLDDIEKRLVEKNFLVQTKRLCSAKKDIRQLESTIKSDSMYLSVGSLNIDEAKPKLDDFFSSRNTSFNIDLTSEEIVEDIELAKEYEKGNFSIERNVYLSLHSGLGIDTYPIGIDEDQMKVTGILTLVQGLSNKYKKPLSVRFVSDGKAKIGEKTDFNNQYLKDVTVRPL